jgi:hypothetical protein
MRTDLLKIRDWILKECNNEINWVDLSMNPRAIHLLKENPNKIKWKKIIYNPAAIEFDGFDDFDESFDCHSFGCDIGYLENINIFDEEEKREIKEKTLEYILDKLSKHPYILNNLVSQPIAISIIEENDLTEYGWNYLSQNSAALHLLENNINKISWIGLSLNENPKVLDFINKHLDDLNKLDFNILSGNSKVIPLLEANKDKIHYENLMYNTNAMHLIEEKINELDAKCLAQLSKNPGAIELLEKYPSKINKYRIWANPMIFTYDYDKIKEIFADLNKEIHEYYYHPSRMNMWNWTMNE